MSNLPKIIGLIFGALAFYLLVDGNVAYGILAIIAVALALGFSVKKK